MQLPVEIAVRRTLVLALAAACWSAAPAQDTALVPFEDLPLLPRHRTVHQFSSHNKRGDNGDSKWHLYRDEDGHAVVFDVEGPGCIRSIWATDIREDAELLFTFDGEEEPRLRIGMLDFFQGRHELFVRPLVSYERRGYWGERPFAGNCFVPIPFAKGLKIAIAGEFHFYHFLYERYPHGTSLESFGGAANEDVQRLTHAFAHLGERPAGHPAGEPLQVEVEELQPGAELELARLASAGCIQRIQLEGPGVEAFLRDCLLQIRWDDHPAWDVKAPLGFFFGSALEAREMRTLPLCVEPLDEGRVRLTSWFPMPFWRGAHLVLSNRSAERLGPVSARVEVAPSRHPERDSGHFTTLYREGWTTYDRDWLFCETPGTGRFVGVVQTMLGEHYCEGDERISLDDAISPQINGTGTEDYYLGCFWPNREFNTPFACCVGDVRSRVETFEGSYGETACYARYHLEAPIPFYSRLDARIQHGGISHIHSSYKSLAFCYLRRLPALEQSDFLDVGSPASEKAHGYEASDAQLTGPMELRPEGSYFRSPRRERGRRHKGGEIVFEVAIDPTNDGVRLRRRLDQASPRQTARVFLGDECIGTWYHPDHNEHLRLFDSDFELHPRHTRGKESLTIRLQPIVGEGRGEFTDLAYNVFCYTR